MANTITSTTLAGSVKDTDSVINVVSATNLQNPSPGGFFQKIYVINPDSTRGELMNVVSVSGTQITVSRLDKYRQAFVGPVPAGGGQGATVLIAPSVLSSNLFVGPFQGGFQEFDPQGAPVSWEPSYYANPLWLNVDNGNQWLLSTVTNLWVPGWNNSSKVVGVTVAVASAAGPITPSGPLFHVTGTAAVTGFNIPVGFTGGSFSIIPDGVFTWTSATNIALAGTAVVNKLLTFQYESNIGKFYPSYTS